ncbi:MAG: penicillin-binding protein 2 [Actinomycetota bacterium]|nr:penicillin-binding protein 2 [Actinomycetota bacterium]
MFVVLTLLFGLMGARLFMLQVVESDEFSQIAARQRQTAIEFPARRGMVLDRDAQTMAISVDLQVIYSDPTLIDDPRSVARSIAPVLGVKPRSLLGSLMGASPDDQFEYVARQVDPADAKKIASLELPGIFFEAEPKRSYPNGRLASHLVGFVNVDGSVMEGVEAQYNDLLEGKPGVMSFEEDTFGRQLPQAESTYEEPEPGRSILLTIDRDIQYFTESALADAVSQYKADSGTAIIMRPDTGEILALANVPDFDPNSYEKFSDEDRRNRALTDVYEPGSIFKAITLAAGLNERVVTPRTRFSVPDELQVADRVIHDSHSHATESMSVRRIITESSNVGTVMMGKELGGELIDRYVHRFGFGSRTGLDFPGESPGIVRALEDWSGSSIGNIPIGQGIAVTPIQMVSAYATIANRGKWVEPKLLAGTVDGVTDDGEVRIDSAAPPSTRRVLRRGVAGTVTSILSDVVSKGTGVEAQIPGYDVAGKTGTAQKVLAEGGYGDDYFASFAGYAPAKRPEVAAIVILDSPTPIYGGLTSAPTFKLIVQRALSELGVAPTHNAEKAVKAIEADEDSSLPAQD